MSFDKELDFVMGAGSLESLSRDRCFACFSRRCLEVSGAKNRDITELCALRQSEGYPCVKALREGVEGWKRSGFGISLSVHIRLPWSPRRHGVAYTCDHRRAVLVCVSV